MKRSILLTMVLFLAISCSTPGRYPPPLTSQAFDRMESFRSYFLQGRLCDAGAAFEQAIDLYAKIDAMCALSDAYVQRYLFHAYVNRDRVDFLEKAEEFATMGNCTAEKMKIDDLISGSNKAHVGNDPEKAPNDIYRSVLLRKIAVAQGDRKHIEEALSIDRNNGWTLFIIHDLIILAELSDDEKEKDNIQKRIDFLSGYIQQCDY